MIRGDDTKFSHEKLDYKRLLIWSRLPGIQWSVTYFDRAIEIRVSALNKSLIDNFKYFLNEIRMR